jgi:NADH-quinone oxidoreductase subunit C
MSITVSIDTLQSALKRVLGERIQKLELALGELTLTVKDADYLSAALQLRDHPELAFEQLLDLCGMDYSAYKDGAPSAYTDGPRFAIVSHLLSIQHNWRLRLRVFAVNDDMPVLASVNDIWNAANWFEREAFDLYGIVLEGHLDLRRILTDYGFIGHPFRKDFPTSGHVEMRYDAEQKRVVYQPVTIEPREITPRIIREDNYGGLH